MSKGIWTAVIALGAGAICADLPARATPGGSTKRALTFAGTLTGTTGEQTLTFVFKAGSPVCSVPVTTAPADSGAFSVEIPLDSCASTLFDGGDVTVDVQVGATTIVVDQPVDPVPYAKYADQVGNGERLNIARPFFKWSHVKVASSGLDATPVEGLQTITFPQAGYYRVTLNSQGIHDTFSDETMNIRWLTSGTAKRLDSFSIEGAGTLNCIKQLEPIGRS